MLKNYIKIAFRNLFRKKLYGTINILGLALGLASSFVIGTWVYQELSYDQNFENSDRIYRVGVNFYSIGDLAPGPEVFKSEVEEFPEVAAATRIEKLQLTEITVGDRQFENDQIYAADKDFFNVFSFPFFQGNPETALDQPNQAVITESVAEQLFSGKKVLGNAILVGDEKIPHTVVGVVEDPVLKTHFNTNVWLSMERNPDENTIWTSAAYYNYVLLEKEITQAAFETRLDQLIKEKIYPTMQKPEQSYEAWLNSNFAYKFITVPLTDLYLKSNLKFDFFAAGNILNVYAFAAIALVIILIAAINFVNISTARSSGRAKEVGIRKTLGSQRTTLIGQFLAESVLTSLFALVLAFVLSELFLNLFEKVTNIHLLDNLYTGPDQILVFVAVTILVGLIAGLYPAFYLSSFKPISMLKNQFAGVKQSWFRNGLVITQFTIATCLIVATVVVYQQLQFMQNKDLGFDIDNVLVINNASLLGSQQETFKQQAANLTGVERASYSQRVPVGRSVSIYTFQTDEMTEGKTLQSFFADEDFLNTMGFQLLDGRNFSTDLASDTAAVILNQSAVQALELENPVGATLNDELRVIGIVADFNYENLKSGVEPAAILYQETGPRLALKINEANAGVIINQLQNTWSNFDTGESMNYYFLDQRFRDTLKNEHSLGRAITLFAVFAIIISCLGLFGLSSYICEQRTKEMGIRKILGAAASSLVILLNKDFTKLIGISIVIAVPLSYYIMNKWLANFAYKIEMNPVIFVLAGVVSLFIAWVTVSGQSIKAALMNPVESLKNE